jgi:hypothetical protein
VRGYKRQLIFAAQRLTPPVSPAAAHAS